MDKQKLMEWLQGQADLKRKEIELRFFNDEVRSAEISSNYSIHIIGVGEISKVLNLPLDIRSFADGNDDAYEYEVSFTFDTFRFFSLQERIK